jgi:hypothetical protein
MTEAWTKWRGLVSEQSQSGQSGGGVIFLIC